MAALATTAVIVAVPGMPSRAGPEFRPPSPDLPMPAPFTLVQTWEHGWPWPFLSRGVPYSWSFAVRPATPGRFEYDLDADRTVPLHGVRVAGEPIAWTTREAWAFAAGEQHRFSPLAAAGDLLACLGLIVGAVALVEWRLRRRGGVLRWTLADLLVGCTALACGLGWARYHHSRHEAHAEMQQLFERFNRRVFPPQRVALSFARSLSSGRERDVNIGWDPYAPLPPMVRSRFQRPQWRAWRYDGPEWLARLVGSREALSWCWRLTLVDPNRDLLSYGMRGQMFLAASDDFSDMAIATADCLIEDLEPLAKVDSLRRLTVCIMATQEEVERFAAEQLGGRVMIDPASMFADADSVALARLRRRLDREGPEPRDADPRNLSLAPLTMTDELLQTYAPFIVPHVRQLTFGPTRMTHEGWRLVGHCENLEQLDTGDAVLSRRELQLLEPLLLRELTLRQGELQLRDLQQLSKMPSLVSLTLREATLTAKEIAKLRDNLPGVEVHVEVTGARSRDAP
ncbi:MAG: hypothetical protein CMJ58_08140 [Planctomycetaceae bacterium]|nr:hypothetical protein [Planctomycetaceae bacterium]